MLHECLFIRKCYMEQHTTTLWEQKSDRNAQQHKAPFLLSLTEGVFWILRKIYLNDTALSTIFILSQVSFCCKEFWHRLKIKYNWYCSPICIQNKTAFLMQVKAGIQLTTELTKLFMAVLRDLWHIWNKTGMNSRLKYSN